MIRTLVQAVVCLGVLLPAGYATSQDSEKGLAIARKVAAQDDGFKAYRGTAQMVLKDKAGTRNTRDFDAINREVPGDGDQSLIRFQTPLDVKGLTVLTHARVNADNDQWLYLPATNRTRRIAASSRSGSFAGSEFAYEDLVGYVIEKYDYAWLRDEACPGVASATCHVNEQRPKEDESGYSRMVAWIDAEKLRVYRVEFYDRRNAHIKTLTNSDYQLYENKFWRPTKISMENHQTGKSTDMLWSKYDFSANVSADELMPHALGR